MTDSHSSATYNAGTALLRDIWGVVATSLLVVTLRIFAKLRINQFGWDDVLMATAQLSSIVGAAMITVGVKNGYGRHVWDPSQPDVSKAIMFDYLTQAFGLIASCLGRLAFIVYLLGVLRAARIPKAILWFLAGTQIIANILSLLIMFLQCPGQGSAIWNRPGQQKCWDVRVQAYYAYFQGSVNSAADLYLALFPAYVFWNLNMARRTKVGLMMLMGLGLFAMIASIVKTTESRVLAHPGNDPTVATVNMDRWLYIEAALVITTASIPCIRSLVMFFKRQNTSNSSVSYELRSRHGVSASARCESRYQATARKQIGDYNSSEDNILESGQPSGDTAALEHGIVRRIDISVSVGPSGDRV